MSRRAIAAPTMVVLALLSMTAACGHRGPPPPTTMASRPAAVNPSDLPPPDAIAGSFTVRQKLVAHSAHGGGSFEAVLQKQPGHLTLLGLTPYGSRAFLLEQAGADVKFTSYIPRELPFPPSFMLLDIHRVFDRSPAAPLADGQTTTVVRGETIRERWTGGHLVQRSFVDNNGPGGGEVTTTIAYDGAGPAGLAAHITLTNKRFGYTLNVETFPL